MTNTQASKALATKTLEQSLIARLSTLAKDGQIRISKSYSVENALKSAFLQLAQLKDKQGRSALETCTPTSISQAMLDMAIQGLNPSKGQCYFIPTAGKLSLFRSYLGTVKVVKDMNPNIRSINADVIHKGDTYAIVHTDDGLVEITDHKTASLETLDAPIIGAYAKVCDKEGRLIASGIMTRKEIEAAWDQSTNKGWRTNAGDVHNRFPQEMAKKTVLGRVCKLLIGSSDDTSLLAEAYQRTSENEWADGMRDVTPKTANTGLGASALKAKLKAKDAPAVEEEPAQEDDEAPQEDEDPIPEGMTDDGEIPDGDDELPPDMEAF